MTAIHRLEPPIDVETPLGDGRTLFLIDYGVDTNTIWLVRLVGGRVKHFDSNDIIVKPNLMLEK
jgi:hypothetical protein